MDDTNKPAMKSEYNAPSNVLTGKQTTIEMKETLW
jgi:hypothetical protein